jgi:Family of unknown function (DUF6314)
MFAAHDLPQYVTAIETCHTDGVFAQGRTVWEWMLGRWTFVREIPGYASARGEAWIRAEGEDRARYEESAQVALAWGGTLRGTQCYLYRRLGVDGLEILFCERGKVFERLTFRERDGGGWRPEHAACAGPTSMCRNTGWRGRIDWRCGTRCGVRGRIIECRRCTGGCEGNESRD